MWGHRSFLEKIIFRLEESVLAYFPGIICDAVENKIIRKSAVLALFFLVLCNIKNLCEQFITVHFVSRHFFCIIKLHSVRTNEADGDFSVKKMLSFRWFWHVFSRITEYRDIRKQFHWPKKFSNNYFASYKIISATTEWMLETKVSKKNYLSSEKKHFYIFSRNTEFCRPP